MVKVLEALTQCANRLLPFFLKKIFLQIAVWRIQPQHHAPHLRTAKAQMEQPKRAVQFFGKTNKKVGSDFVDHVEDGEPLGMVVESFFKLDQLIKKQRMHDSSKNSHVLPFASHVMWQNPTLHPAKLKKKLGLWFVVGEIKKTSNAHLICTRVSIVVARTIRRLPASERGEGVSASSNRVPNLPKPTVAKEPSSSAVESSHHPK